MWGRALSTLWRCGSCLPMFANDPSVIGNDSSGARPRTELKPVPSLNTTPPRCYPTRVRCCHIHNFHAGKTLWTSWNCCCCGQKVCLRFKILKMTPGLLAGCSFRLRRSESHALSFRFRVSESKFPKPSFRIRRFSFRIRVSEALGLLVSQSR